MMGKKGKGIISDSRDVLLDVWDVDS